jgi:hypothetical protein
LIFKWLGSTLLLGIASFYSVSVWRQMQGRMRLGRGWISLLTYVRGQISCFGTPLQDILVSADEKLLAGVGVTRLETTDFSSLCHRGAEELQGASGDLLLALGDEIGTIWRAEQVERLDYYIAALEEQVASFSSRLQDRVRLHATLSLSGALAIILLMW